MGRGALPGAGLPAPEPGPASCPHLSTHLPLHLAPPQLQLDDMPTVDLSADCFRAVRLPGGVDAAGAQYTLFNFIQTNGE